MKSLGILVVVLGVVASFLFVAAAIQLNMSANELQGLRSMAGGTVNEHYYRSMGDFGVAYARVCYALAAGSLMLSFGLGGMLMRSETERDQTQRDSGGTV